MSKFDIEYNGLNGVAIVTTTNRLTTNCLLDSEIDAQVAGLKRELEVAVERAKQKIREVKDSPMFTKR